MSDATLRELERQWRVSHAAADRSAYLLALVRADRLTREQLGLLARLGDPVASRTAGVLRAPRPVKRSTVHRWIEHAVVPAGLEAVVRAALFILDDQRRPVSNRPDSLLNMRRAMIARPGIEAVEDWCLCPCPAHAAAAGRVALEGNTTHGGRLSGSSCSSLFIPAVLGLTGPAAETVRGAMELDPRDPIAQLVGTFVSWGALSRPRSRAEIKQVTDQIAADLGAWVLGVDPVAERVRARHS